jgi:NAD(P)-dependent dehydrogenase (short-subunit alcohol dehydrogenase family)
VKPLQDQIALVTGASRGIGAATAIKLARLGAHVILTARTQGGLEETDNAIRAVGGTATLLPLDLTDGAAVDLIGPTIYARFKRLDILVHNAGELGVLTPISHIQNKDWDQALAVNATATLKLIRTTAPLLSTAPGGRAVFVTTHLASETRAYWGTYAATKAALQQLALTWAAECETLALRVNLFDPGATATRMRANAMPGEDPKTLPQPADVAVKLVALCLPTERRNGVVVSGRD